MKNRVLVFVLIASIITMFCGNIQLISAAETGFLDSRDDITLEDWLDKFIISNNPLEAAVGAALIRENSDTYENVSGYMNKEENIKATNDSIFEWGSITKLLTWVSIMQLYEQGKLELNTDIRSYLPEGFLTKVSFEKPVTILDLMNHTGGWQDSITNVYTDKASEIVSLADYVSSCEPPQIYEPGAYVAYSNWSVTLAGYIVERVSGESYIDYVNENIFDKLGMTHSSIDPLRNDNEYVKTHHIKCCGYMTDGTSIKGQYYSPCYPAAGAAGTLGDMELFIKALLKSEGNPLFESDSTVEEMFTPTNFYDGSGYPRSAHGFWYDNYQTQTQGHSGNTAQFSAHLSLDRESGRGTIIFTNQQQEMALTEGFGSQIFGSIRGTSKKDIGEWVDYHFQDRYVASNTIKKGYCSFYNFFMIYNVSEEAERIKISSPMMSFSAKRVANDMYVAEDGFLKGYRLIPSADSEGNVKSIGLYVFDLIANTSCTYFIDVISFILIAIAIILNLAMLIYDLVHMKKRTRGENIRELITHFLQLAIIPVFIFEMVKLISTTAVTSDMIVYMVLYILLALFYVVDLAVRIISMIRARKFNLNSCFNCFINVVLAGFILYWQMFIK